MGTFLESQSVYLKTNPLLWKQGVFLYGTLLCHPKSAFNRPTTKPTLAWLLPQTFTAGQNHPEAANAAGLGPRDKPKSCGSSPASMEGAGSLFSWHNRSEEEVNKINRGLTKGPCSTLQRIDQKIQSSLKWRHPGCYSTLNTSWCSTLLNLWAAWER